MLCLDDKLSDPVSITGWNWTKTERKIRETIENGWNCQNEMEPYKLDTTVWNLTRPYEIEQNIQRHETVIDQMDIRTTLNNEKKKIKTAQNYPKSEIRQTIWTQIRCFAVTGPLSRLQLIMSP